MPKGVYKRTSEMKTGKHMLGRKLSEITKLRIGKKVKGKKNGFYGKTHTPEVRAKIAETSRGKVNEQNGNWKGDDANYGSKHIWVYRRLGQPHYCEHCKRSDLKHRQYHWANVSGEYKRIISDWIRLCVKCHKKYDKDNSLRG